eukprot:355985-Chlamydomonas_euryale.AAC.1
MRQPVRSAPSAAGAKPSGSSLHSLCPSNATTPTGAGAAAAGARVAGAAASSADCPAHGAACIHNPSACSEPSHVSTGRCTGSCGGSIPAACASSPVSSAARSPVSHTKCHTASGSHTELVLAARAASASTHSTRFCTSPACASHAAAAACGAAHVRGSKATQLARPSLGLSDACILRGSEPPTCP